MFTIVSVHLPTHVLLQLLAIGQADKQSTVSDLIDKALALYLAQSPETRDQPAREPEMMRGYQWKNVFLPEGTIVRSWSYGENNYARVEGDQLMHRGRSVSPNQFARSFARTFRNAWMDLSIKRPQDKNYIHANRLRRELSRQERSATEAACVPTVVPQPQPQPQPQPPQTAAIAAEAALVPALAPAAAPEPAPNHASLAGQLASLLTQTVATAAQLGASSVPHNRVAQARNVEAGAEWCLPERRKFRFRMEDIDF
ncbi:hypothetical protein HSX11_03015 [Oxalobacteraceae bacterium]|nr:hypothetical protein [Oxalobacteraceae bacterium]